MHMSADLLQEIDYPESDGKPMAETPVHMRVMWDSIQTLDFWFADDPKAYVWGNMFLYYRRGDPTAAVSPDVMAVFGVEKSKERRVFKTWEEKRKPSGIIEITSRKTKSEDQKDKFLIYRDELKVKEYFLFDPLGEYLKQALIGYRLRGGDFLRIEEIDGRLPSKVFNLHLQRNGRELRFWNPLTEAWLPTPEERRTDAEREREYERFKREFVEKDLQLARKDLELEQIRTAQLEAENKAMCLEIELLKHQGRSPN
jgi:Uma2 family endonuclease